MAMMSTLMAAMSSFYPEANPAYVGANIYKSRKERNKHIYRVLGCAPAIAAACYRHSHGLPIIPPNENLSYTENFLYMMDVSTNKDYKPKSDSEGSEWYFDPNTVDVTTGTSDTGTNFQGARILTGGQDVIVGGMAVQGTFGDEDNSESL